MLTSVSLHMSKNNIITSLTYPVVHLYASSVRSLWIVTRLTNKMG